MSKGDSPRPHDPARYRSEWERIFAGLAAQRVEQLRQERYAAIHGLAESEAMDEHARPWGDEFAHPARGETGEEGGAT
jgi:hypothetical protein